VPCGPLLHQRTAKAPGVWLAIYYAYIIGYKWRTLSVRPVPPAFYVAALLLLSLPYLTSIIDICILRALHRARTQLPECRTLTPERRIKPLPLQQPLATVKTQPLHRNGPLFRFVRWGMAFTYKRYKFVTVSLLKLKRLRNGHFNS
jgi:hypothetical protein